MLTVAVPKRNKLPNIIVLTPKDGPKENETDVEEISAEITKGLEILPVSYMSEVLKHALIF